MASNRRTLQRDIDQETTRSMAIPAFKQLGPMHRQRFRFAEANIEIGKNHLLVAQRAYHRTLHEQIEGWLDHMAEEAVYEGRRGNKLWLLVTYGGFWSKTSRWRRAQACSCVLPVSGVLDGSFEAFKRSIEADRIIPT